MTTAQRRDTVGNNGGDGSHSRLPLLHLLGTEYGLRIAADGPQRAGVNGDGDRGRSDHG
jgi:hypothetical protein